MVYSTVLQYPCRHTQNAMHSALLRYPKLKPKYSAERSISNSVTAYLCIMTPALRGNTLPPSSGLKNEVQVDARLSLWTMTLTFVKAYFYQFFHTTVKVGLSQRKNRFECLRTGCSKCREQSRACDSRFEKTAWQRAMQGGGTSTAPLTKRHYYDDIEHKTNSRCHTNEKDLKGVLNF